MDLRISYSSNPSYMYPETLSQANQDDEGFTLPGTCFFTQAGDLCISSVTCIQYKGVVL